MQKLKIQLATTKSTSRCTMSPMPSAACSPLSRGVPESPVRCAFSICCAVAVCMHACKGACADDGDEACFRTDLRLLSNRLTYTAHVHAQPYSCASTCMLHSHNCVHFGPHTRTTTTPPPPHTRTHAMQYMVRWCQRSAGSPEKRPLTHLSAADLLRQRKQAFGLARSLSPPPPRMPTQAST
jgi:hypothetical protein